MLLFRSKRVVKSATAPGVEFVVRKMTDSRRAELTLSTSDINQRLTEKYQALRKLRDDKAEIATIKAAMDEIDLITSRELNPAQIRWAISEIRGLQLELDNGDVVPATTDNLNDWPMEVLDEAAHIVSKGNGLTEADAKN